MFEFRCGRRQPGFGVLLHRSTSLVHLCLLIPPPYRSFLCFRQHQWIISPDVFSAFLLTFYHLLSDALLCLYAVLGRDIERLVPDPSHSTLQKLLCVRVSVSKGIITVPRTEDVTDTVTPWTWALFIVSPLTGWRRTNRWFFVKDYTERGLHVQWKDELFQCIYPGIQIPDDFLYLIL